MVTDQSITDRAGLSYIAAAGKSHERVARVTTVGTLG
jgi:hypothetical protein